MPVGKRAPSAMEGKLRTIHVVWIPAIPAGKTLLLKQLYNQVLFLIKIKLAVKTVLNLT
jgi:hypothetical protein